MGKQMADLGGRVLSRLSWQLCRWLVCTGSRSRLLDTKKPFLLPLGLCNGIVVTLTCKPHSESYIPSTESPCPMRL